MAFELINTDNVADSGALELLDAHGVSTTVIDGTTYLFVAGAFDDGLSVFAVDADGTLTNVDNITDAVDLQLDDALSTASAEIGGITYLFAAGDDDGGISVFAVREDGSLVNVDNVNDNDPGGGAFNLDGARSVTTLTFGATTYLFVAGRNDHGVSVFSVDSDGILTNVDNVTDGGSLELLSASSVTTAVVNSLAYLFVTGITDDGVSVFRVSPDGTLTPVFDVTDGGTRELDGAAAATTAVVGDTTYLFVAGLQDDGVSVFSVSPEGALTSVDDVTDGGALELNGANGLTTTVVDGITYLFVTGSFDHGISVFSVANDGTLTNVVNLPDGGDLHLQGANSAATTTIGGVPYLFVSGGNDSGVSVFSLAHNIIDETAAAVQIAENALIGTQVATVAKVDATDSVAFSIGGADAAFFAVDAATGLVVVDAALDFEAPGDADGDNVYEIEITADDGIISETKAISVTVTDVDEPLAITSD
ncbi:MAG: beta-propeller fold lactonase family protein, partial [Hyphomicrobiales bacterium]|nr:beta-propeller fold lactonase family protein [Hyphomicrobiales bacterium]